MADEELGLSEILSATETPSTAVATEEQTTTEGVDRDALGRYAPKAPTEPVATAAPEVTPPAPVATTEPDTSGTVPQQALHESRQREKDQRERNDALERRIAAFEQAQRQPPAPVVPAVAPPPPDFWEDPNAFVNHALTPMQQALQQQKEGFSRMLAEKDHGKDAVQSAYQALGTALQSDPSARGDYQRIMASQHPYEDLVAWHKGVINRQRIGNDPDAFVQSELEKMFGDPAKKAELLARLTGTPATPAAPAAPSPAETVTNVTRLPPSLSRLPGGNAVPVDGEDTLESIIQTRPARANPR